MADSKQTESGMEQYDNTDRSKTPSLGYEADVKRQDNVGATLPDFAMSSEEDKAMSDAQTQIANDTRRDHPVEEKFPSDPLDPELEQ